MGRMPAEKLVDGLLILIGGVVLLTPGLITDIIGILLLIPVTRLVFKRWLWARLQVMAENRDSNIFIQY